MGFIRRFLEDPLGALYFVPIFLITITVHEVAHAYVAWRLGDPTARAMGRISFNPLRHIDPIGLILLFIIHFGWAKPVPINPRNFKNEKAGMAISALAGPMSNILMAFVGLIIWHTILALAINADITNERAISVIVAALRFFQQFAMINAFFAVFNLLPVPPLDGSRLVDYFLPPKLSYYYSYVERYGFLVLILLMITGILMTPLLFFGGLILAMLNFPLEWIFSFFI